MPIKRVKLNYRPAFTRTPPIGKIVIPSNHLEQIDISLKQKVRQNEAERIASMKALKDCIAR